MVAAPARRSSLRSSRSGERQPVEDHERDVIMYSGSDRQTTCAQRFRDAPNRHHKADLSCASLPSSARARHSLPTAHASGTVSIPELDPPHLHLVVVGPARELQRRPLWPGGTMSPVRYVAGAAERAGRRTAGGQRAGRLQPAPMPVSSPGATGRAGRPAHRPSAGDRADRGSSAVRRPRPSTRW